MNMSIRFFIAFLFSVIVAKYSATANGSGYIDCTHGTLNVILSAPHGGPLKPGNIPDRTAGCYEANGQCNYAHNCGTVDRSSCRVTTRNDMYTKELTQQIANHLEELTDQRPHVVINNLARVKLDANREVNEAAFGDPTATQAYGMFQQCINDAKDIIEGTYGRGLFLDIHGHGHPQNWAELGYLISKSQLNNNDLTASKSSVYHLSQVDGVSFERLLRGNLSFGFYLEKEGYAAVPSPYHLSPQGQSYYSGGHNTRQHGSRDGGKIDAIQIESSYNNRRSVNRDAYANALANAIVNFLMEHY